MIRIRGRGLVYGELWYDEPPREGGVDVLVHRRLRAPLAGQDCRPFLSLVSALDAGEAALAAGFDDTCSYQVRRAAKRDGLAFAASREARPELGRFCDFFDTFAAQKALPPADRAWLEAAAAAGQLALAAALKDGATLVWHAYLLSGPTASLHHSASWFRQGDNDYRALVGRANRWLHWQAMLWFAQAGLARYDWGGLFEDESSAERAGINRFKRSFGGAPEKRYDCSVPRSARGRMLLPLRDAWRRYRAVSP